MSGGCFAACGRGQAIHELHYRSADERINNALSYDRLPWVMLPHSPIMPIWAQRYLEAWNAPGRR